MKQFFISLLALLLVSTLSYGQVIREAGDTTSLAQDLRAAYSTLNLSRLATGILMDRIPTVSGPHNYDGSAGATTNTYSNWQQQYWEYYQAVPNPAALPTLANLRQAISSRIAAGQIPLVMLAYRYDELRPDAVAQGLVRIDSAVGRVYDGPNFGSSPYQQRNLFAVALARPLPVGGSGTVWVGSDFWLGTTPPPTTLTIDFGDGQGPRSVAMNSSVSLNLYQSPPTNPDNPTYRTVPGSPEPPTQPVITLPPPAPPLPANTFSVLNPANGYQALSTLGTLSTLDVLPDAVLGLKAAHTWSSFSAATALGWVKWGDGNTTKKFRKPLIFVEGIDFGCDGAKVPCSITTPTSTGLMTDEVLQAAASTGTYRNGTAGWNEMVDYNDDFQAVEKLPRFREQLTALGYDLVYLDFSDGATHIQSNAMTLVELLDYINNPANRTADATETIVTAASMGGQVARFALAWMEQQGLCHNSKLYVSIDSPHRGANIPLGLQYMIDRLRGMLIGGGDFDIQRDKLMRPASQQMLVYHFSPNATSLRTEWQAWQASPGSYPGLMRKVAIADGNRLGQALPGAYPGMELLTTTALSNSALVWGDNFSNSLPGAGSRGHDNVIFRYKSNQFASKWHYTQVNSSYPTYDQAPGGTRTTTVDAQKDANGLLKSGSEYRPSSPPSAPWTWRRPARFISRICIITSVLMLTQTVQTPASMLSRHIMRLKASASRTSTSPMACLPNTAIRPTPATTPPGY